MLLGFVGTALAADLGPEFIVIKKPGSAFLVDSADNCSIGEGTYAADGGARLNPNGRCTYRFYIPEINRLYNVWLKISGKPVRRGLKTFTIGHDPTNYAPIVNDVGGPVTIWSPPDAQASFTKDPDGEGYYLDVHLETYKYFSTYDIEYLRLTMNYTNVEAQIVHNLFNTYAARNLVKTFISEWDEVWNLQQLSFEGLAEGYRWCASFLTDFTQFAFEAQFGQDLPTDAIRDVINDIMEIKPILQNTLDAVTFRLGFWASSPAALQDTDAVKARCRDLEAELGRLTAAWQKAYTNMDSTELQESLITVSNSLFYLKRNLNAFATHLSSYYHKDFLDENDKGNVEAVFTLVARLMRYDYKNASGGATPAIDPDSPLLAMEQLVAEQEAYVQENTIYALTVLSDGAQRVRITVEPADLAGASQATTPATFTFKAGTEVRVTAPGTVGDMEFASWRDVDTTAGRSAVVTMRENRTITAAYNPTIVSVRITSPTTANSYTSFVDQVTLAGTASANVWEIWWTNHTDRSHGKATGTVNW
ncbi:hypothetical protein D6833_10795, partial [Candidatus Parcubacteria bacterium]